MTAVRKKKIHALLKGVETGDPASVTVANPNKYIQHNPQTHEGEEGLAALFKSLSKTSPRVNIVRIFPMVILYSGILNMSSALPELVLRCFALKGGKL